MSCEVRRVVLYDDANQGILPGMDGYFCDVHEPSPHERWWNGILDNASRSRRRSAAFYREIHLVPPLSDHDPLVGEQLELLFDAVPSKISQHPGAGLVALAGLVFADSGFFESQRAAGVQDPALDVLEDLVRGRDDDQK